MEPYMTIVETRKHPTLGPIFGVYLQPDVISSKEKFESLLPEFKCPQNPSSLSVVKITDKFLVRREARWYSV